MHGLPKVMTLLALLPIAGCSTGANDRPVDVTVLAINDFHGNLEPPAGSIRIKDPADPARSVDVPAGGSEAMATLVKERLARNPNSVFVAAGDLIGASPLLSGLFHDEPTIESLSMMGLAASAVGNHEFDEGATELLRMQDGGCGPANSCAAGHRFAGARFQYLAASTIDEATGRPILPAYVVREFQGIPVAFIGLTLKGTPNIVSPTGVAGLRFEDEADTVNRLVPELQAKGIQAIGVLIHEGGFPTGGYNECPSISGPIVEIVKKFDKAVDFVVSGHTHQAYNCRIDGRLVTSADKFGTLVTDIELKLDPATRDVIGASAENLIVRTEELAKDPAQTALIATYQKLAEPLENRPAGVLSAPLTKAMTPAGEMALGNLVADAQLAATRAPADGGAEVAFTNPGGIRTELPSAGPVTYGQLFAVQPFGNAMVTLDLTGRQILTMLEQQWQDQPKPRILQVSDGFTYRWDERRPVGSRVVPGSAKLDGHPIRPDATYRVAMNSYLADGGDKFTVLQQGVNRVTADFGDVEALDRYFQARHTIVPPRLGRIVRVDG